MPKIKASNLAHFSITCKKGEHESVSNAGSHKGLHHFILLGHTCNHKPYSNCIFTVRYDINGLVFYGRVRFRK